MTIQRRIQALEAKDARSTLHVCADCRRLGVTGLCAHIGVFFSLLPPIEAGDDWHAIRAAGRQAVEQAEGGNHAQR